jgi:hypothetical protein
MSYWHSVGLSLRSGCEARGSQFMKSLDAQLLVYLFANCPIYCQPRSLYSGVMYVLSYSLTLTYLYNIILASIYIFSNNVITGRRRSGLLCRERPFVVDEETSFIRGWDSGRIFVTSKFLASSPPGVVAPVILTWGWDRWIYSILYYQ